MSPAQLLRVFSTSFRLCLIELGSNKARTFITSFGIFLGVASLLSNLAFVRGMDDNMRRQMESIGGLNIITVDGKRPETPEEKLAFQFSPGLTLNDGYTLAERVSYIKTFLVQVDLHWQGIKGNGKSGWGRVKAVGPDHLGAYNYKIDRGRVFTADDFNKKSKVCIVGMRVAKALFGEGVDPTGQQVTASGITFTVIGTIKSENDHDRKAGELLMPYPVYQLKYGGSKNTVGEVVFALHSSQQAAAAKREIGNQMRMLHRGVEDYEIEVNVDKIKEMEKASLGMKVLLGAIAVISLVAGGVSIMNIMFATIEDRIREIGVRMALGARAGDIFTQFVIEAVLISFVGGFLGMFLGSAITFLPEKVFPIRPFLDPTDYLVALGFTMLAGVVSGLFPALKAARMQPVEALRY
jgi:putative ABC transport system permease protein